MRHIFTPLISTWKITSRRTDSKLMFFRTKLDITCLQHLNHVVVCFVPRSTTFSIPAISRTAKFLLYICRCTHATALPDAACCRRVCVDSQTHVTKDISSRNSLIKSPHNSFSRILEIQRRQHVAQQHSVSTMGFATNVVRGKDIPLTRALSLKFVSSTGAVSVDVESAHTLLHPKHLHWSWVFQQKTRHPLQSPLSSNRWTTHRFCQLAWNYADKKSDSHRVRSVYSCSRTLNESLIEVFCLL